MLGGDTRVRSNGQLIRLDQLSGSGPVGPQGETGPRVQQGRRDLRAQLELLEQQRQLGHKDLRAKLVRMVRTGL